MHALPYVIARLGNLTLGGWLVMSYRVGEGMLEHCVITLDGTTLRTQDIEPCKPPTSPSS